MYAFIYFICHGAHAFTWVKGNININNELTDYKYSNSVSRI